MRISFFKKLTQHSGPPRLIPVYSALVIPDTTHKEEGFSRSQVSGSGSLSYSSQSQTCCLGVPAADPYCPWCALPSLWTSASSTFALRGEKTEDHFEEAERTRIDGKSDDVAVK